MARWLKGGVISLLRAVPTMLLVAKDDKKSIVPMGIMSIILGTLVGVSGFFML